MEEWNAQRFAAQLKRRLEAGGRFAFFLGAGCSISSGIPGAGELVREWLPQLHKYEADGGKTFEEWLAKTFPKYKPDEAGHYYADVMQRLYPQPEDRQEEIEHKIKGRDPGFGYAVLAQLISHPTLGSDCNLILTTNFDDMVADALYLYTKHKPMVILHESLSGFAETRRVRPLVVKLHGDALLTPKNTPKETFTLPARTRSILVDLLFQRALIFLGYGGNDRGVLNFLKALPKRTLKGGVYWVNDHVPDNAFGEWLKSRSNCVWVKHRDFDELMLWFFKNFELTSPDPARFNRLLSVYRETFERLSAKVAAGALVSTKKALATVVDKVKEEGKDWWSVHLAARQFRDSDPAKADEIYRQGLARFGESAALLGSYANFLRRCDRMDEAQEFYLRALGAAPHYSANLGNYASFVHTVKKDLDQAEKYYRLALDADPDHATNLGNYASFLWLARNNPTGAKIYYQRALEADANHNPANLSSYGAFLQVHGSAETGLELLRQAVARARRPEHDHALLRAQLYLYAHGREEERPVALNAVRSLLKEGIRSRGWEFGPNLERAAKDGHPNTRLLNGLAAVIVGKADLLPLDEFEEWRNAAAGGKPNAA